MFYDLCPFCLDKVKIRNITISKLPLWSCAKIKRSYLSNLTPYPSILDFWKIKLEKSSSSNCIFSQQKSISKLIFAGYTGSKNQVRNRQKIQFVELDFSKLIFQKSSTDQQGDSVTKILNALQNVLFSKRLSQNFTTAATLTTYYYLYVVS